MSKDQNSHPSDGVYWCRLHWRRGDLSSWLMGFNPSRVFREKKSFLYQSDERPKNVEKYFQAFEKEEVKSAHFFIFQFTGIRVARFFLVQNTKTVKNIPIFHELYQMSIRFNKRP
jgi:hypothetical protein